jgi:hypothetical protein
MRLARQRHPSRRPPRRRLFQAVFLTPTLSRTATPPHFSSKRSYSRSLVLIETLDDEMETAVRATRSDHSPFSKCMDAGRCTRYACVARHACDAAPRNGTVWLNADNGLLGEARTGGRRWRGLGPLHDDDAQSDFVEIMHVYRNCGVV